MLQRVGVDGDHPDGSGPLMVLLVDVLVEGRVVEESELRATCRSVSTTNIIMDSFFVTFP